MEVCNKQNCTACGACAYVCPQKCITMEENPIGVLYPVVDHNKCVACGKCSKICPSNTVLELNPPQMAYAAWSSNPEERRTSASGGIAAEIYRYAMAEKISFFGAKSNADFSVSIVKADPDQGYQNFKNSKYVYSSMELAYPQLAEVVGSGETCIFIGLPCQVAAVKKIFPKADNIIFIDLVCHGIMPYAYLNKHIASLEMASGRKAKQMSFRDVEAGTQSFTFTLYDEDGNCFYAKRTKDWDSYQVAYHRIIGYRDNCYRCNYARAERVSDITLSDYKGLGTFETWKEDTNKVSCILVHTQRGAEIIDKLIAEKRIVAHVRPIEEPIQGDSQLRHPSEKNKSRADFERQIVSQNGDFEKTMRVVIARRKKRERFSKLINSLKKMCRVVLR